MILMNKKKGLGKFLLGAGIGAGLGILFAPKKGSETRRDLKKKMDELIEKAKGIDIEEVRENIEYGLITEEEAIRDAGGQMYGDRIQEIRIARLGKGYSSGSEATMYTVEDLYKKPRIETVEEDDDDDLFDDDDL